jgi:hypothetical protein
MLRVNYAEETKTAMREEAKAKKWTEKQINDYMDRQTATRLQREPVISKMLSFPPEKYRRLVDPYDKKADVTLRARSYLHANCSLCHVEAGGGNAQMELEFTTPLDKMNVVNVKPLHHTFDLPDARLIVPGHPERSVLLQRISGRKEGFMPPLATTLVDEEAVKLVREWIKQIKEGPKAKGTR